MSNVVRLFDYDPDINAKYTAIYDILYQKCQEAPMAVIVGMLEILKLEVMVGPIE